MTTTQPRTSRDASRLALPAILLAQFLTPLSIAGVGVALPSISARLGDAPTPLQWVVNAFNVAFALFTVCWGIGGDRLGHARTFTIGVTVSLGAAVLSAASSSLLLLDAARALAGIGAAAIVTGATALLSRSFPGARRARAFAAFGTANGVGLALGPSLSAAALAAGGWRAIFVAHAVLLTLALIGCRFLPRSRPTAPEPVAARDLRRGRVLRHPGFLAMVLVPVAEAAGFVTLLTYLPTALQAVHGDDATAAGVMMLAMTVPVLLAPALVHRLGAGRGDRFGSIVCTIALGCLVAAPLGLLGLAPHTPVALILLWLVVGGLGFGLPLGIVDARALGHIPLARQGAAAGVLNLFRFGSEAVFVAAYGWAITALIGQRAGADGARIAAGAHGHAAEYLAALRPVLIGVALLCAALWAGYAILDRRASRPGSAHLPLQHPAGVD